MKKIFAIAIVGLMVAFSSNAIASEIDSNNDNVEFVIENAHVDAVVFEFVPVLTKFVFNVADESVNSASVEDFGSAVNTDKFDTSNYVINFDVPIDYGICSTNIYEFTLNKFTIDEPIPNLTEYSDEFTIDEPIPNLTEYDTSYNYTNGYASPEIVKGIASNVGKS